MDSQEHNKSSTINVINKWIILVKSAYLVPHICDPRSVFFAQQ